MSNDKVEATFGPWIACPECDQGKHGNCDGTAWDVEADDRIECPCAAAGHH